MKCSFQRNTVLLFRQDVFQINPLTAYWNKNKLVLELGLKSNLRFIPLSKVLVFQMKLNQSQPVRHVSLFYRMQFL